MNYLQHYCGLGGNIKQAGLKIVIRGCKTIQKNAKYLCPVDTGQLRNSIKTKSAINEDSIDGQVYTNSEHAPYPEFRYWTKRGFK